MTKKLGGVNTKKNGVYGIKSARLRGYEYTKSYYNIDDNGLVTKSSEGTDADVTVFSIRKDNTKSSSNSPKTTFIFNEGYVGATKAYNSDGTLKYPITHTKCFGLEYLIQYIENSANLTDNFHLVFHSENIQSEKQAIIFSQIIKDLTPESVDSLYMWCHSKGGILALRALQILRDNGDSEVVLGKLKRAILTGLPTEGLEDVNRAKMIDIINSNTVINLLPFSGFIKTFLLKIYDTHVYTSSPAHVDLIPASSKTDNPVFPENINKVRDVFNKVWGNDAFRKQILSGGEVPRDIGYIGRVNENMAKIDDLPYNVLPVTIDFSTALDSLIRHCQLMPFLLFIKQIATIKGKGDGIVSLDNQGFRKSLEFHWLRSGLKASHDLSATPEAMKELGKSLLGNDEIEI